LLKYLSYTLIVEIKLFKGDKTRLALKFKGTFKLKAVVSLVIWFFGACFVWLVRSFNGDSVCVVGSLKFVGGNY